MINNQLINPKSIAIIGGSENVLKPGGKILKNIIDSGYKGSVYVVNPKHELIQNQPTFSSVSDLPQTEMAILAIPSHLCYDAVKELTTNKGTKAFIIISAGFSEESTEGARLENEIVKLIDNVNGCLIGPNCIGVINHSYCGVFTPIVPLSQAGCDFVSASGATAVYIMEAGINNGLQFSNVYSVGNSAQLGVEDVVKYMDETFNPATDSRVKLLYMESIQKPEMLLKHASSLIRKGCKIAAIKAGGSEAGKRAASSHTGALAKDDLVVNALLRKAGIVRCISREELTIAGCIFINKELNGKNIAIITHAGGPAVMLTDALSKGGMKVPKLDDNTVNKMLQILNPGSSALNPVDIIATGTGEQLVQIIDICENELNYIDGMCVIFGTTGLMDTNHVFNLLSNKIKECKKPIFPVLPSVLNGKDSINCFIEKGNINFPDEVALGNMLTKIQNTFSPQEENPLQPEIDIIKVRSIIDNSESGYLPPLKVQQLLDACGISRVNEIITNNIETAVNEVNTIGFPVAMKIVGPIHKTDVGGVVLNIRDKKQMICEFERMIKIPETTAILIQPMLTGTELFLGAKNEEHFGHMVVCGLGGIFVEVFKDVVAALTPLSANDALDMINDLNSVKLLEGYRGTEPVNKAIYADIISRVAALCSAAPEIFEMDINPLLGKSDKVVAVDTRIRIERL